VLILDLLIRETELFGEEKPLAIRARSKHTAGGKLRQNIFCNQIKTETKSNAGNTRELSKNSLSLKTL